MDSGTQISLGIVVSAISGVLGAVGAYVKVKSDLVAQYNKHKALEKDVAELQDRKKEAVQTLHKRIDTLKNNYNDLQKEVHQGHQSLETKMAQMELRIVREIQKLAK